MAGRPYPPTPDEESPGTSPPPHLRILVPSAPVDLLLSSVPPRQAAYARDDANGAETSHATSDEPPRPAGGRQGEDSPPSTSGRRTPDSPSASGRRSRHVDVSASFGAVHLDLGQAHPLQLVPRPPGGLPGAGGGGDPGGGGSTAPPSAPLVDEEAGDSFSGERGERPALLRPTRQASRSSVIVRPVATAVQAAARVRRLSLNLGRATFPGPSSPGPNPISQWDLQQPDFGVPHTASVPPTPSPSALRISRRASLTPAEVAMFKWHAERGLEMDLGTADTAENQARFRRAVSSRHLTSSPTSPAISAPRLERLTSSLIEASRLARLTKLPANVGDGDGITAAAPALLTHKMARHKRDPKASADEHYRDVCRDLAPRGLFGMRFSHPVRRVFILWATSPWFRNFVLLIILANCITLAMTSNEPGWLLTPTGEAISILDYVFNSIFILEMVVKIIAMGFVASDRTYLRDGWNGLDFIVVSLSVLGWIPGVGTGKGTTALRTIRALRPLRTITRVPGLRALVGALIASMPMMLDVFVLFGFLFTLFGIIGVELLNEKMSHTCWQVTNVNGTQLPSAPVWGNPDQYPWPGPYATACSGPLVSEYPHRPASTGLACLDGWWCGPYVNNNYGAANFDNIGAALLCVLYAFTTSYWTEVMYQAMDALSPSIWVFFCSMVIACAWFAANLAIAVLYVQFADKERRAHVNNDVRDWGSAEDKAVWQGTAGQFSLLSLCTDACALKSHRLCFPFSPRRITARGWRLLSATTASPPVACGASSACCCGSASWRRRGSPTSPSRASSSTPSSSASFSTACRTRWRPPLTSSTSPSRRTSWRSW